MLLVLILVFSRQQDGFSLKNLGSYHVTENEEIKYLRPQPLRKLWSRERVGSWINALTGERWGGVCNVAVASPGLGLRLDKGCE